MTHFLGSLLDPNIWAVIIYFNRRDPFLVSLGDPKSGVKNGAKNIEKRNVVFKFKCAVFKIVDLALRSSLHEETELSQSQRDRRWLRSTIASSSVMKEKPSNMQGPTIDV